MATRAEGFCAPIRSRWPSATTATWSRCDCRSGRRSTHPVARSHRAVSATAWGEATPCWSHAKRFSARMSTGLPSAGLAAGLLAGGGADPAADRDQGVRLPGDEKGLLVIAFGDGSHVPLRIGSQGARALACGQGLVILDSRGFLPDTLPLRSVIFFILVACGIAAAYHLPIFVRRAGSPCPRATRGRAAAPLAATGPAGNRSCGRASGARRSATCRGRTRR